MLKQEEKAPTRAAPGLRYGMTLGNASVLFDPRALRSRQCALTGCYEVQHGPNVQEDVMGDL